MWGAGCGSLTPTLFSWLTWLAWGQQTAHSFQLLQVLFQLLQTPGRCLFSPMTKDATVSSGSPGQGFRPVLVTPGCPHPSTSCSPCLLGGRPAALRLQHQIQKKQAHRGCRTTSDICVISNPYDKFLQLFIPSNP